MAAKYDPFLYETGSRIRTIRKQRHMTQMDLAEKIGNDCSGTVISRYENGEKEMGLRRFADILKALEVSPEELLGNPGRHDLEAGELFSLLNNENRAIILKQMEALLLMQKIRDGDPESSPVWNIEG